MGTTDPQSTAFVMDEVSASWQTLAKKIGYLTPEKHDRVRAAFDYARQKHGDQRRKSGELFFTHPVTVAGYLADYKLDGDALVAALLHDVAEDTMVSVSEIRNQFGDAVARLVDGVTKFEETTDSAQENGKLSKEQIRDATLGKLFAFMTQDVRVVIIKLFDRLHNMQTLGSMPQHKRKQKAEETLYVYAPLANRLGMWTLKNALQSLSLHVLDEPAFHAIHDQLDALYRQQEFKINAIRRQIRTKLDAEHIPYVDVVPSPRNVYTIYEKVKRNGDGQFSVDKTPRLVVIVPDRYTCYTAMGAVHELWDPVPGSFDDYIARPRENLYRALHSTVIYKPVTRGKSQNLKLRFRTEAMNIASDVGVLAHWAYGGHSLWSPELARQVNEHVAELLTSIDHDIAAEDAQEADPTSGVRQVVEDILQARVTIYTPDGEARVLPEGSTAIDFAYRVHTDVGNSCRAALVNKQLKALNEPLKEGDMVEVLMFRQPQPQRIWLDEDLGYLKTSRARMAVRRHFRKLDTDIAIRQGRELLREELRRVGYPEYAHEQVAEWMGFSSPKYLYYALGRADVLATAVATKVLADRWTDGPMRQIGRIVESAEGERFIINNAGLHALRLCQSCNARPADPIVGFIRKDNHVTIHQEGCHTLTPDPYTNRLIRLSWGEEDVRVRFVEIDIRVHDRPNLLNEITDVLRPEKVNIASIRTVRDTAGFHVFVGLEVPSPRQLVRILHRVQALVNVHTAYCCLDDGNASIRTASTYQPE